MVLNEVTTHTARAGDLFPLLVDRAVVVNGTPVPVGTKAWGAVVSARENGSAGTAGKLSVRLLWIALPDGDRLPLAPAPITASGAGAGVQTVAAAVGFGMFAPLALLARGNNAKLKAGEIVEGRIVGPAPPAPDAGAATPPVTP